ncbi:MAG: RICIN domain-containing protein [Polyangiaceae bacterium]
MERTAFALLLTLTSTLSLASAGCKLGKDKGSDDADVQETMALFGDQVEHGYGRAFERDGMFADLAAGPALDPNEPDVFSVRWVGQQANDVLRRAVDKEFQTTSTRPNGMRCLMFFDDRRVVRRLMIMEDQASHEYAMSERGDVIFWYRASRQRPPELEHWGYFHRGNSLRLYQIRENGGDRRTEAAPADVERGVLSAAQTCMASMNAANPQAAAAGAAPVPQRYTPPPVGNPGGGVAAAAPLLGQPHYIRAKHSNKCLAVRGAEKGAFVTQEDCQPTSAQHFRVWQDADGVRITVDATGFCIDIEGGKGHDGASLLQWPCAGTTNQRLAIRQAGDAFELVMAHSQRCLDVRGVSFESGANLQQWGCGGGNNQKFVFDPYIEGD